MGASFQAPVEFDVLAASSSDGPWKKAASFHWDQSGRLNHRRGTFQRMIPQNRNAPAEVGGRQTFWFEGPVTARFWRLSMSRASTGAGPTLALFRLLPGRDGSWRAFRKVAYVRMGNGTASCNPGHEIHSPEECFRAHRSMGVDNRISLPWFGSSSLIPGNCTMTSGSTPPTARFNLLPGPRRWDAFPVCRQETASAAGLHRPDRSHSSDFLEGAFLGASFAALLCLVRNCVQPLHGKTHPVQWHRTLEATTKMV